MTQATFATAQAMADILADHLQMPPTTPALLLRQLQPGYSPRLEYTVQEYTEALCEIAGIGSKGVSPAQSLYAVAFLRAVEKQMEKEAKK